MRCKSTSGISHSLFLFLTLAQGPRYTERCIHLEMVHKEGRWEGDHENIRMRTRLPGFKAARIFFNILTQSSTGQSCMICRTFVYLIVNFSSLRRPERRTYIVDILILDWWSLEEIEWSKIYAMFNGSSRILVLPELETILLSKKQRKLDCK